MALRLLRRAADKARKVAASKAKTAAAKKAQEAAKKAAARAKAAAKSPKASKARIQSLNATAKAKKTIALKKANEAKPQSSNTATTQQIKEFANARKSRSTRTNSKISQSDAAKAREKASTGVGKKSKAPAKLKTTSKTKSSSVKSPLTKSETLRRREARRSTKVSDVGKSKAKALTNKSTAKAIKGTAKSSSKKGVTDQRDKRGRLTKEALAARRSEARKRLRTTESKGKTLTRAQRDRAYKTAVRDIGAKAAAAKTPKSVRKTVEQAGGPARKGSTPKDGQYDLSASQRDGKATLGKPQPKSTNAPQTRKGRVERNARTDARRAVEDFEVKARKTISDRVKREAAKKGLSGTEQSRLRQRLTRQMNAGKRRIKAAAEGRSTSSQKGAKTNTNPSVAYQEGVSGRDWRNRMSDTKVQNLSKDFTTRLSGKPVRGKGELVQSPKGTGRARQEATSAVTKSDKAKRSASARSNSGTGSLSVRGAGKKADTTHLKKAATSASRTQPTKPRVATKKDSAYEPKGIDPQRSNAAAAKARQLKKDNPSRRLSSDTQPKRKTATRRTADGKKSSMYSNKPSRPSNARSTSVRQQRSDAALRRRNEAANKASRRRAGERALRQTTTNSPGPTFQNKETGSYVPTQNPQYSRFMGKG